MKLRFILAVIVGTSLWLSPPRIQAATPSIPHVTNSTTNHILDSIESATTSACADARIYQWKRVDRETLAAQSNVQKLHELKGLSEAQRASLPKLDSAVADLKSAGFHHSVDQVTKAAAVVVNAVHAFNGK